MKVGIYCDCENLPFGGCPRNPDLMFKPGCFEGWSWPRCNSQGEEERLPARKHPAMPVLEGLCELEIPRIMGHVVVDIDKKDRQIRSPEETRVQITTLPSRKDERGMPVVVQAYDVLVSLIWDCFADSQRNWASSFSPVMIKDGQDADHWKNFFLTELKFVKKMALGIAEAQAMCANSNLRRLEALYENIPE